MRLKSALEDFEINTLSAVPGLLGRLAYIGGLHDGNGSYGHWGLAKVYGEPAAQHAMQASHRVLLSEVLRKPLAVLLSDVLRSCSSEDPATQDPTAEEELLARLAQTPPKPLSRATQAHLEAVLSALSALLEKRNIANPRGASQPRPPALESRPPAGI